MERAVFCKARAFVYRHARPLDLARWQYHFENGSREAVLHALAFYQNDDGGFGHALEPDLWNRRSTPIGTWAATEILREIGWPERGHPIVRGILKYLASRADFDEAERQWRNVVPENNDDPHAIWWRWNEAGSEFRYNPTAALAGFLLRYGDGELYRWGEALAAEAVEFLAEHAPFAEMHVTGCLLSLWEACADMRPETVDLPAFTELMQTQVRANICTEPEKWFSAYEPRPSEFVLSPESPFYAGVEELVRQECAAIVAAQAADGAWPVVWRWHTDYREYFVAADWWKSALAIRNLRFLRAFCKEEQR